MTSIAKRRYDLDALRIFACVLIVLLHAPMPTSAGNGILLCAISYMCITGVCIFFMLSGYLLLPVKTDASTFLGRRLGKLIGPTVIWSIVYLVYHYYCNGDPLTLKQLLSIPFSTQGSGILWFLYALIGLYLILPVISPWLDKITDTEAKTYFWLFILVFCLPLLQTLLFVNTTYDGAFYYFCGYGGYIYIAWFIKRYPHYIKYRYLILTFVASLLLAAADRIFGLGLDFYSVFWTKSVFLLVQAIFWLKVFISLKDRIDRLSETAKRVMATVSNLTFGIYLVHIIIIRLVLWNIPVIAGMSCYPLQIVVITILAFIISAVLCYLLSLTRAAKYIIGYTSVKSR